MNTLYGFIVWIHEMTNMYKSYVQPLRHERRVHSPESDFAHDL